MTKSGKCQPTCNIFNKLEGKIICWLRSSSSSSRLEGGYDVRQGLVMAMCHGVSRELDSRYA